MGPDWQDAEKLVGVKGEGRVVMPIGVIGLGLMGSALAERLLGAGHRVMGWDIDPGRIERRYASEAVRSRRTRSR